jgi:Gpi18-like mannosyltransferase
MLSKRSAQSRDKSGTADSMKRISKKNLAALLAVTSLTLRFFALPYSNRDLQIFNLVWYETLYAGIAKALGTGFANYTPPYTYFLALATFTRDLISPLTAIKLIPTLFDVLGAFLIYKIVKLKFEQSDLPYLAGAIYFSAPTVMINSSFWGQADSLYTASLLACLYLLMIEKPLPAIVAIGVSFSFKAQAVFLAPFLLILALRKKFHWLYFGLIPLVYIIAVLPVILLGRPARDALLIYTAQSNTFDSLTMNAPNFYYLLPREWLAVIVPLGILITAVVLLRWAYNTARGKIVLNHENMLLLALISLMLMPFLLPKMHDRYFYPADVVSIALAFYNPSLWFVPVFYQIISATAISGFLFNASPAAITLAVFLNAVTIAVMLRAQRISEGREKTGSRTRSVLSWGATLVTPLVLFGLFLNFLPTPTFIRIAYALPIPLNNALEKSERFQLASQTASYLISDKKPTYFNRFQFENGKPVFNENEIALMDKIKNVAQFVLKFCQMGLLTAFMLGLLAWSGNWLTEFRQGIRRGGWLAVGLGIVFGLAGAVIIAQALGEMQNAEMLKNLFPMQVLQSASLLTAAGVVTCGLILTRANASVEE